MNTDTPRPELTPQQRASLERGLAQSAAGEVYDLGSFAEYAEYADTPRPERVTLTDEVLPVLREAWREDYSARSVAEEVAGWAAAREKALREENADLRSRLGCINEATNWDRPYNTRLNAIRGLCDLSTDGMTPVARGGA